MVVSTWSIATVNAVLWLSVFSATIGGKPSFAAIFALIGVQIKPLAYVAMKFIFS